MAFDSVLNPRAIQDIQKAIDYYDEQEPGLGNKFENFVNDCLIKLEQNPFFQIRYDHIHCLPLKKYPYIIHFTIDESKQVITKIAVFNTARNPKIWKGRK